MRNTLKFHQTQNWVKDASITVIVAISAGLSLVFFPQINPATKIRSDSLPSDSSYIRNANTVTQNISGKALIMDGDSLTIKGISIRLHGIDAPEMTQTCLRDNVEYHCGRAAKTYLTQIINSQPLTCTIIDTDGYGRKIGKCVNDRNIDINAEMVLSGNAIAYLHFSYDYERQQTEAKSQKKGIWAGEFMEPYQFRRL